MKIYSSQRQLYFFTRQDLLTRLNALEKELSLNVHAFFGKEDVDGEEYKYQFSNWEDFDKYYNIGISNYGRNGENITALTYGSEKIGLKKQHYNDGSWKFVLDFQDNVLVKFSIGGIYKEKYLIRSEIGVYYDEKNYQAKEDLFKTIRKVLNKKTEKYGVYRIGEEAYQLAKEGKVLLLPDYIGHEGNAVTI
jgi:hypothetical protein